MPKLTNKRIETEAEKQRLRVKQTLPIDVRAIAALNNLTVTAQPLEDEVSGMLVVRPEDGGAIGVNETHVLTRQRFTLAHEIGHFVLHRGSNSVFVDAAPVFYRKEGTGTDLVVQQEREANRFAAALLMPEELVRERVNARQLDPFDEAGVKKLAAEFGVSPQAMTYRLMHLGLLD